MTSVVSGKAVDTGDEFVEQCGKGNCVSSSDRIGFKFFFSAALQVLRFHFLQGLPGARGAKGDQGRRGADGNDGARGAAGAAGAAVSMPRFLQQLTK